MNWEPLRETICPKSDWPQRWIDPDLPFFSEKLERGVKGLFLLADHGSFERIPKDSLSLSPYAPKCSLHASVCLWVFNETNAPVHLLICPMFREVCCFWLHTRLRGNCEESVNHWRWMSSGPLYLIVKIWPFMASTKKPKKTWTCISYLAPLISASFFTGPLSCQWLHS